MTDPDAPRTRRGLQHMIAIKPPQPNVRRLYDVAVLHAVKAEKTCPGAGMLFFELISGDPNDVPPTKIRTRGQLSDKLRSTFSRKVYDVLMTALDNMHAGSSLSIRKTTGQHPYLELSEGYTFPVKSMLPMPIPLEVKHAKVICIDGFVENVSEVHHLLEAMAQRKEPCAIFARGMSNDVLHTIKVNCDRKTILAFPYAVPFDLATANTMVDVATVAGGDVVSSLRGDLISSLDMSSLTPVDSCLFSGTFVKIRNARTQRRVKEHVAELRRTMETRPEVEDLLAKRLKTLVSSCIDIALPDDVNFFSTSQQVDEGIRMISAALSNTYDVAAVAIHHASAFRSSVVDCHLL